MLCYLLFTQSGHQHPPENRLLYHDAAENDPQRKQQPQDVAVSSGCPPLNDHAKKRNDHDTDRDEGTNL
ncbi:MAG TPA: hypothetical protein DIT97_00575 [Gimesia maris]|uniref:Uncharacterized protein n=1 Tax=Gimesia maris TaxID=122 RepID=A0A3D3QYE5_9PLAN|nr:hypothetical protein [Gimesia maris]